ncbi:sugar phosphate isomerase/epimerase family protein [Rhodoferax sp.]|uniref:sugar phosphate isomerase/epimerase family protein n=1 Tax=Rhodoferax sp. TaxID=50421 RepID=UPI0028425757|nr:sugar phosphate isomerase/epimerase family protein [Rhodoferax sp.]MDR3371703.1 sugar phosphate isomerase/epimerase [Rhodoferax sp.]
MTSFSANIDDFGVDSASLAGPLEGKLSAVREAGFAQIVLCASDLVNHPGGIDAAVAAVQHSGLRVSGFQSLHDFEGLPDSLQAYKIDVAKAMLGMCHALNCHLMVASASTLTQARTDNASLIHNLRQLAMLAIPKNIRIAYQANPQAHTVKEFGQAWDLVCMADMPNLGLCLDTAEVLASTSADNDLEMLDSEKLFLVQLADTLDSANPSARLFPGEGEHRTELATMLTTLHGLGYRGDYCLSSLNADYLHMPASIVVRRAWDSALWLGQDVLQRSVPLPNQIRLKRVLAN